MEVGITVNQRVDLPDVTGPYEIFGWVDNSKGLETVIVSSDGGAVTSGNGICFNAHASFAEVPALDVVRDTPAPAGNGGFCRFQDNNLDWMVNLSRPVDFQCFCSEITT